MSIQKDDVGDFVSFYAYSSTDHITPKDGLSSFTVYYSLNNGVPTAMTTPTVTEKDATNMTGWYHLAVDEAGMVSAKGELNINIEASGMDPVAIKVEIENLVDDIWDELLTGATHNISNSAGRRLREVGAYAIESGTAQAGNGHSITLAATASATDGLYNRNLIVLTDNTGVGQTRTIVDYNGSTKVAALDRAWKTTPDATTEYQITADDTPLVVDHGLAQAGAASTITLRSISSAINDTYCAGVIAIVAGTGTGQSRLISGYVGSTKVATITPNWVTNPDSTSVYIVMPYGCSCVGNIGAAALTQISGELNDITVADIIAGITDGSYDLQEMQRLIFSACCLKVSGGGSTTISTRDSADGKDRIVATVNSSGDRTAVTLDGS